MLEKSKREDRMVRCWNCEHLVKVYSGRPASGKLFQNEYCKCKAKRLVFERYNDITEERECKEYRESKNRMKYEEIAESIKQILHGSLVRVTTMTPHSPLSSLRLHGMDFIVS